MLIDPVPSELSATSSPKIVALPLSHARAARFGQMTVGLSELGKPSEKVLEMLRGLAGVGRREQGLAYGFLVGARVRAKRERQRQHAGRVVADPVVASEELRWSALPWTLQ